MQLQSGQSWVSPYKSLIRHAQPMALSQLNAQFEAGASDPPPEIWNEWLWGCELAEPTTVDCLLNKAHLIGLLIARFRAVREPELMDVCIALPHMVHQAARVACMTPRQVKDVIEDLQLHWATYVESVDPDELTELVDACMTRLGFFHLHPSHYEDVGMRDAKEPGRMNVLCARRLIGILCVLYRHLDLLHRWVEPIPGGRPMETIQEFHVQSSVDEYYKHAMRSDLPPGALLNYRQDFAGFYHCVSQAVYFHFPSYERKPQLELDALREGCHPVNVLSLAREMYPEIHLCCEDETPKANEWNWMLMGKRVYLLDAQRGRVFYSPNLLRLMETYLGELPTSAATPSGSLSVS